ncbi:MAG TPA: N,N-dimethylformamidase beta subunit family domain-containing protein [Terriglobia bacterium]|nr:N,N-dimethylformamidase beta subunit family domain-containing protein [Terriglobia bacterium]
MTFPPCFTRNWKATSTVIFPRHPLPAVFLVLTVFMAGCGGSNNQTGTAPTAPRNPIQLENAKPGTTDWKLTNPATNHEIEGYASATSVNRGGQIQFFVNTVDPTYTLQVYRLGWYNGLGGRQMTDPVTLQGTQQEVPSPDPTTGIVECHWKNPYTLTIPNSSDPTDWTSGVYVAKLTSGSSGKQSYIIFVVRDDARHSDFLYQQSVSTYEAYNNWGGKSLYDWNSTGGAAMKVSFDRPYAMGNQSISAPAVGSGEFLITVQPPQEGPPGGFEFPFVRFLEREGYDVTYSTDVDTAEDPAALLNHKALLIVGHDEYWNWAQRANVIAARDAGVSLGFFSSNTMYWQIRYEPDSSGTPDRTIVCYKTLATTEDPDYLSGDPNLMKYTTVQWRQPPVNLPEDAVIGVMYYTNPVQGDIVVDDASSWVYNGTGLTQGSHLKGLLGYEVDQMYGHAPAGTDRIAHSVFGTGAQDFSDATVYTAPSGAIVFATGSMEWSWGLDDYGVPDVRPSYLNPDAQQVTRNVLARFTAAQ